MLPKEKEYIHIQSYKHDKSIHRTWSKAMVIEANDERIIAITDRSYVIEADERKWTTREPAICFFYPNYWFNVICMIRKKGIYYYCNIASPSVYDGEALKNIDYDLDVKISPDFECSILDQDEYEQHKVEMGYSDDLDVVIHKQLNILLDRIERRESPFDHDEILRLYNRYLIYRENR